jgi:plastocyanin
MRSGVVAAGLLTGAALLLSACGGGSSAAGPMSMPSAGPDAIIISNFMFSPMSITVAPGATVKVTNQDSAAHTLTATAGQFNTGDIAQNQTKTFTAPTKPGRYSYICNIHQYMVGTITVS